MTNEGNLQMLRWRELYRASMMESDRIKLPPLLDAAINAVLDEIEDAFANGELEELNKALNILRSRRKEVSACKSERTSCDKPRAA